MNDLVEKIDLQIEKYSLLKHIFYKMWSEGKLTRDHLKGYSKEYFQLVKAVPQFVENIFCLASDLSIRAAVKENLNEEAHHTEPWIDFAVALGVRRREILSYHAGNKTNEAITQLNKLTTSSLQEAVGAMYAYEMQLPKISRTKIDGLNKFYRTNNNDVNEKMTRYFQIHEEADLRHAQVWRQMLQNIYETNEEQGALYAATRSLEAQNKLLDSVQEKYVDPFYCNSIHNNNNNNNN